MLVMNKQNRKLQQSNASTEAVNRHAIELSTVADGLTEKLLPNCGNCLGSCSKYGTVSTNYAAVLRIDSRLRKNIAREFWANKFMQHSKFDDFFICFHANVYACQIVFLVISSHSKQMFRFIFIRHWFES